MRRRYVSVDRSFVALLGSLSDVSRARLRTTTQNEVKECKGLRAFGKVFHDSVRESRSPQGLVNVVFKWKKRLTRIQLPPSSVADIDQVRKDARRDSVVVNGKLFERSEDESLQYLVAQLSMLDEDRKGRDVHRTNASRYGRLARQILMAASRTVSGADSYFVCQHLFLTSRPDFHLTPSAHDSLPTRIDIVDRQGDRQDVYIRSTNCYKITTHDHDHADRIGSPVMEWLSVRTTIRHHFKLPRDEEECRIVHHERWMSLCMFDEEMEEERPVSSSRDRAEESTRSETSLNVRALQIASPSALHVKKMTGTNDDDDSDDDDVDLRIPPPKPSPERSPVVSPVTSPERPKERYDVTFTDGSLGLGYKWIPECGPIVRAIVPNSQADRSVNEIRVGDVVVAINGAPRATVESAFILSLHRRPVVITFKRGPSRSRLR